MTWVYYIIAAVLVLGVVFWLVSRKKDDDGQMSGQDQAPVQDQTPPSVPPSTPPTV